VSTPSIFPGKNLKTEGLAPAFRALYIQDIKMEGAIPSLGGELYVALKSAVWEEITRNFA
jgi:hypothetical protein